MNVCVIGAGASGLACAIVAAQNNNKVFILEKNNKSGKKLLLTGNGRCNYWNEKQDYKYYHSTNNELLKEFLQNNQNKVLPFFQSLGIIPKIKNGYYYPYSNQATSILNALLTEIEKLNIPIYYEEEVMDIKKEDKFIVKTKNNLFKADKVVMAMGSKAYPKTGSDGKGYEIAYNLGHKIIPVCPSLVQLIGTDNFYQNWDGVRCEVIVTHFENEKEMKKQAGEIQLTNYGVSGICIFNLSRDIARGLQNNQKEQIAINFVPWCQENFISWMNKQSTKLKDYTLKEILAGFLNPKIINLIFKIAKLDTRVKWQNVNKEKIAQLLTSFKITIIDTKSFASAQVCSGGISLEDINLQTMESKKVKGLYFTGEILDVDGDCGGYNLGFAWMSGILAGESVNLND